LAQYDLALSTYFRAPTKKEAPRGNGCTEWWRRVRQASYKGVPFEVEDDTKSGGRDLAIHQYPSKETYDVEDLGKIPMTWDVSAYVIGDNVENWAQLLYEKCTQPGSGLLVLPLRDPVIARCETIQTTNVQDQQGRWPVQLRFVEIVEPRAGLQSSVYYQNVISDAVTGAAEKISAHFEAIFDTIVRGFSPPDFVPDSARKAAAAEIRRLADKLDLTFKTVLIDDPKESARAARDIRRMRDKANILSFVGSKPNRYKVGLFVADQAIRTSRFASLVSGTVRRLGSSTSPEAAYLALLDLAKYEERKIERAGNLVRSERAELRLASEVARLARLHALIRTANVATRRRYRARPEAIETRALLSQRFQAEIGTLKEVELADALRDVLQPTTSYITQQAEELPSLVRLRIGYPQPACVVAATLYNDASMGRELLAINDPTWHPLLMPTEFIAPYKLGNSTRIEG
jgi:hypothetical protein